MRGKVLFKSAVIAIIVLVCCIFAAQSFGTSDTNSALTGQAPANAVGPLSTSTQTGSSPLEYGVVGLLLVGGVIFLLRPRRRVETPPAKD